MTAGSQEAASTRHRASEVSPDELRHPHPQVVLKGEWRRARLGQCCRRDRAAEREGLS